MSTLSRTFILCVLALSLCGCDDRDKQPSKPVVRPVKSMVIGSDDTSQYRSYPGRVSASQKVNLSFQVSGHLIELTAKEGEEVKIGQLLARIDPRDYQIKVDQEKAKYDLAEVTFIRYKKLLPTEAVSKSQYDEKKSIYLLHKANLAQAEKALKDTYMYAPFNGLVAKRYVENHQYVQAKQEIVSLQDISDIEIITSIPEQDVARSNQIERLAEAGSDKETVGQVNFAAIPNQWFPVTVKEVNTEADPTTQTYTVTLLMQAPKDHIILPGMTASVRIKFIGEKENYYLVPIEAIATDAQGKNYVWIINDKTMEVQKQVVQLGDMQEGDVKVVKGLKPGQRIVTAGVPYLEPNMKVKLITTELGKP